ncbi:O-antigen polymerase [Nonlabens sp. YIK11]|nr:O-antigen polymerase [Nonlabens sp. YIK11]
MAILFAMPIIPRGIRPFLIGVVLLLSIVSFFVDNEKFKWQYFLLNSGLFVLYCFSLLYTEDLSYGIRKIAAASSLLIFPLIIACMSKRCVQYILDRRYVLMWFFIIATLALNILAFSIFSLQYSFEEVIIHFVNIIRSDIPGLKIHPIYLSMHIGISMIFSLFLVQRGLELKKILILITINIIFLAFLLILIKKGPIIALVIVSGYLVFMFKNRSLYLVFGLTAIGILATIIFVPKVNERFSELLQIQNTKEDLTNSTNIRFSILQCAAQVMPEAGFLGFGVGDGKEELIQCYQDNATFLAVNRYNSHNQFLGIILNAGYLGLALFSIFLLYHLIRAFNRKNHLFIATLLFYCIVMLSENILERENGVLYFSLFINLFLMLDYKFSTKNKDDKPLDNLLSA